MTYGIRDPGNCLPPVRLLAFIHKKTEVGGQQRFDCYKKACFPVINRHCDQRAVLSGGA
jgi:hypothetical protein